MDPKISDLIGRLFPELEIKSLDTVDIGWASDICILNGEDVIKVPRDSASRKALEKEMKITSVVRSSLPVRIPEYFRRTGNEELEAAAYALIDGVLLTNQDVGKTPFIKASDALAGDSGCVVAGQVSEIMSSIHSIETSLVRDALKPFVQDTWKEKMQGRIRSFREVAASLFKSEEKGKILALLDELACKILGFSYTKRFIHGDFGGWNMLYNPGTERISGLIWIQAGYGHNEKGGNLSEAGWISGSLLWHRVTF